ncbi:MAG: HAD family hydrolase [Anaeroplasmataceae bacterium]|nr:HAD family hydrolase [Anaeroplasmataceae bacterium]
MRNIFFDLYGTLIDIHTDEENPLFWQKLTKRWRKYHTLTVSELKTKYLSICSKFQKEKEEIDILAVFKELLNLDDKQAIRFACDFRKYSTKYIRLYPQAKVLLKNLKKRGYGLYVLSNAQNAFTVPELKRLGIYKCFDGIAISSDYGVKKPNEAFFLNAIKEFDLSISSVMMIGNDYECDIMPAQRLGLKTIFIQSNLTPKHDSKDYELGFNCKKLLNKITNVNW